MANPTTPSSRPKRKAPENPTSTPPSARLTRSALSKQQPKPEENGVKPEETELKPEAVESAGGDKTVEEKTPLKTSKKPKKEVKPARKTGKESGKVEVPPQGESSEGSAECEQSCEEEVDEKVEEKVVKQRFAPQKRKKNDDEAECRFLGEPIPQSEAEKKWPVRYKKKSGKAVQSDDDELPARRHYRKAEVDGEVYGLNDSVYIKAEDGKPNFIGRIIEFFESTNNQLYFTVQWFFRAEDTVIAQCGASHDPKRVFLSDETNTNVLDCIVSKITIMQVDEMRSKVPHCDFYYDMMYTVPYTSFTTLSSEKKMSRSESSSTVTSDTASDNIKEEVDSDFRATLLDLYSGCGAMSTGLCIGAQLSGLKLETAWAVDLNPHACKSLQHNHTHTQVRNMNAEHFLILLKEWEKLCKKYGYIDDADEEIEGALACLDENSSKETDDSDEEFEVERFLDICYGDPTSCGTEGLKFKVRWKGYDSDEDTWEPMENLGDCQERLQEFVRKGQKLHILPCPGDVDVICGGPPCQGISGFNRFRNYQSPLEDVKNRQIVVFMDIVTHLRPKYVLMENVVDLLKFSDGFLGRYAVSRLVQMNYQSRLGIMAAGCYGLPQFRGRAFLWGALTDKKLPQFPLPTHDVVVRGNVPKKFELNLVAFDENQPRKLKKALYLADAISDLPQVENDEDRDEITYDKPPKSDFQQYIRLSKSAMMGDRKRTEYHDRLFDHRPLKLNEDDYQRVQRIPVKKGANFRDLPGLLVRDNVVELDPAVERVYLPSKKPLVPDYAISFLNGKSTKPFGRLWWDEIVPTVVTRAEPHNQVILHPEQYRVLTIRENARLQGFPDHYQLFGPVKERYIQVGNAVAVPAARALGFCLGKAFLGLADSEPLLTLPADYP